MKLLFQISIENEMEKLSENSWQKIKFLDLSNQILLVWIVYYVKVLSTSYLLMSLRVKKIKGSCLDNWEGYYDRRKTEKDQSTVWYLIE